MSEAPQTNQLPKPLPSLETQPKEIALAFQKEEIDRIISRLADQINLDYKRKDVLIVGILKGCLPFMADLLKKITVPCEVEFVRLSSYGGDLESKGTITVIKDIGVDIKNRHILIAEEIIDTGRTLKFLCNRLKASNPASLKIVTLFDKHSKRVVEMEAEYVGQVVDDYFLIGYGLDLAETCRNLPDVYYLKF